MRLSFDVIVHAVEGTVIAGQTMPSDMLEGVGTDSRAVTPGSLFVCIPGETFDGHDFAKKAADAGAAALLASRNPFPDVPPVPVILVEDTIRSLGRLANFWRHTLPSTTKVVGITGTAGKTTVKELLAQVLERHGLTARNPLNLNNQIGLPLSMLAATGKESYWVMEAGISHPNDMDELGAILEPDIALILNVGPGHAAGLGDRGTAHYKARLLSHLAPNGTAIISADYPDLVREARMVRQDLVFFSTTGRQVEYRSAYVVSAGEGKGLFRLNLDGETVDMEAPFRGTFGAENVIAVAAVAHRLGVAAEDVAAGLAEAKLPKQRFACSRVGSWLLVDDSYNANPLSFGRMLESVSELAGDRTGHHIVCVLGEMGELGELAKSEHQSLGRKLAAIHPDIVLWKGQYADDVETGLLAERAACRFRKIETPEDMMRELSERGVDDQAHGGVILFKGSRINHLERMVDAFRTAQTGASHAV